MTDEELKELVASLAIDSKNLHEAQKKRMSKCGILMK